jgi:hypothetical protein
LELSFSSPAVLVAREDGVYLQVGVAAARGEASFNRVGLFPDEADIEHRR